MSEQTPPAPGDFGVGSHVAGYRLDEQIGRGGMAVVYRAHDARLDRRVSLKILAELCAGIYPPGVCNFIAGHGDPAGAGLVTHDDVDMVSLTGSPETGKWIAQNAAESLKRVHLELGGKAPVIVFDDVDMEAARETIAGTGYFNAGQDCTAATRVLASKGVYDDVVSGLADQAKDYKTGDTFAPDTVLGPLAFLVTLSIIISGLASAQTTIEAVPGHPERRSPARLSRHW